MHIEYWHLNSSPFAGGHNDHFHASASHEEALARLHFLIENRRRLGFLLGPPGTGKSMLFDLAVQQLRQAGCQVCRLNLVGLSEKEFVWKLALQLGQTVSHAAGTVSWWTTISDQLAANRYQQTPTVILLDDVDRANEAVMSAICRLVLTEQTPDAQFTIVLALPPQRLHHLDQKLNDICDLRVDLEPWTKEETREYLRAAISKRGGSSEVFSSEAAERVHQLSHGNPRRVRQLAELCLVAGAGEELTQISPEIVDAVYRSLTSVGLSDAAA